jgi:hypothetical protein
MTSLDVIEQGFIFRDLLIQGDPDADLTPFPCFGKGKKKVMVWLSLCLIKPRSIRMSAGVQI